MSHQLDSPYIRRILQTMQCFLHSRPHVVNGKKSFQCSNGSGIDCKSSHYVLQPSRTSGALVADHSSHEVSRPLETYASYRPPSDVRVLRHLELTCCLLELGEAPTRPCVNSLLCLVRVPSAMSQHPLATESALEAGHRPSSCMFSRPSCLKNAFQACTGWTRPSSSPCATR